MILISLIIILLITNTNCARLNTKLQCLQPNYPQKPQSSLEFQEQVVCFDVQDMKELNALVHTNWRNLKILNEKTEIFQLNDIDNNFSELERLDLSQAGQLQLNDDGFKAMPNLVVLNISGTALESLKGSHFATYNKLENLDASWNTLTEITFELKNRLLYLQYGNFSNNAITTIDRDLWKTFQKLKYLHLDNNELKAASFCDYPQLQLLTLSDNQIEEINITSFSGLDKMDELKLTANPLRHIGKHTFSSMTQLKCLNVSANSLDLLDADVFAGLNRLLYLDLNSNNLRELAERQFQHLAKLQYLDLSRNRLTELNSTIFINLSSLRKLFLYENDLQLLKSNTFVALISLDTLDLSQNNLEYIDADVFGMSTLPRMKKLLLKSNNIKRLHPLAFASLPFIQYLSLGNNELTTLDVRMFAPMRRLDKLHLGNNLLETIAPEVLDSLTDVSELLIDNNRLSFLPDTNATFSRLRKVSIEGNPWQCPCWDVLVNYLELRKISYVRDQSPYYSGKRPLCVVTTVHACIKDINLVKKYEIEDIYNRA
ncbi:uncharacterized protein isoform X1 [Musca autumnalis]|uniref:uncharacterized protein isoform X1 n=2 Tax=Musca autumnalis TaxID=221902 RepID=UPI003CE98289